MTLQFKDIRADQVTVLPANAPGGRLVHAPERFRGQPAPASRTLPRLQLPFLLIVVLPVLLGFIYNFMIASDRFAVETSFMVRKTQIDGGVAALIEGNGLVRSDDDSFAVVEFFESRDAFDQVNKDGYLRTVFEAGNVDMFSRFPTALSGETLEDFYRHFQDFIDVDFNTSTGIVTLEVQAFAPSDAVIIAERLLSAGEELVNRLNNRAREDNHAFAKAMVDDAETKLSSLIEQLTKLRHTEQMIDPQSEMHVNNSVMLELSKTQSETEAKLAQLKASSPRNPSISELELQVRVLKEIIQQRKENLAGDYDSLVYAIENFEQLRLERTLAEKRLIDAVTSLYAAEDEAQKGRVYLQRIVEPTQPDRYGYPRRYLNVALVLAISLLIFWIIRSTTTLFLEKR